MSEENEQHVCRPNRSCVCSIAALEPNEDCPIHGYPTRFVCVECGRFMGRFKATQYVLVSSPSVPARERA